MPGGTFHDWLVLMSVVLGVHAQLPDQRLLDNLQGLQTVQYISLSEYDIGDNIYLAQIMTSAPFVYQVLMPK